MAGIKRWLAALLAGIVLISGAAASAESTGRGTVDIQESVVSREGESAGTLKDHLLLLGDLLQTEEVRNLLKIEDVKTITSEVIAKVAAWMINHRPVTMKIFTEFGFGEADVRCIGTLWDSADRIAAAVREYEASEEGKRLAADRGALFRDPDFREMLESFLPLLTRENLDRILADLRKVVDSWDSPSEGDPPARDARPGDGPLAKEAMDRQVDPTSVLGSLLLAVLDALDADEWAGNYLPDLLQNENLWRFVTDLTNSTGSLDRNIQAELEILLDDPEMIDFADRSISALFSLLESLSSPAAGNDSEKTEDAAP